MKRTATLIAAALVCLLLTVTAFAENVYIVDDDDDFIPPRTTTAPQTQAETTTARQSLFGDSDFGDTLDSYIDSFAGKIGEGVDSIISGFGQYQNSLNTQGNAAETPTSQLPQVNSGSSGGSTYYSSSITTAPSSESTTAPAPETTAPAAQADTELASVLIINNTEGSSSGISGSTLTLIVFIAAVVILVLVVAIVLVIMTRRTEFNSAVMNKSTIPSVDRPGNLAQLMDDDIPDDGDDYSNIAYWNNDSDG